MANNSAIFQKIFTSLEGTWTGQGRGGYPTVTSFDYRERLTFTRRDEKTIAYEQRAQKRYDGQTEWLESHWENGFIRVLESGELEMTSAQIGRVEALIGKLESKDDITQIDFISKAIANDPRMLSSARSFELEGDTLRYEVNMQTTKTDRLTGHLKIALHRA